MYLKAFAYGVVGDLGLQWFNKNTDKGKDWGLNTYFSQWTPTQAVFNAGILTTAVLFTHNLIHEPTPESLFLWGAVWDVWFRTQRTMTSLDGYYSHLNFIESILWAGFPASLMAFF